MTEENRAHNIQQEIGRAERCREEASLLFAHGLHEGAVARAYYCVYHAAQALLLTEGLESRSHGGLSHLVNVHFVRTGRLEPGVARFLGELQQDRSAAEYDAASVYTEEIAREKLERADSFLAAVRALVG